MKQLTTILSLALCAGATVAAAQDLPKRPEQIAFKPLVFNPPKASDHRHVLSNGTVVFLAPSNELPLVELEMTFKGGEYLEPADKVGLAAMTAELMRTGGTESLSPSELDERLDFLATEASVDADATTCSASLDCLSSKFDESLSLLMDMLRRPRFDDGKRMIALDAAIEGMKQRNDDADSILSREWAMHMYGADHFEARQPTEASMNSIGRDDMAAFARKVFNPSNVVVAVSGDFEPKAMLAKLEAAFAGWEKGERMADPPAPPATFEAGVFRVEKEIPQGKVYIGRRSMVREDPDYFAALVMNEILGGGGFTSRIMKTVRSDEGLAYSAGSGLSAGVYYPGVFRAGFQSKNPTVALAVKLIENEFRRMRDEPVGTEELAVAKQSFIETFPRSFESKPAMLGIFVADEWTGRSEEYWQTYRENIDKVTAADVQRVAARLLDPKQMAIFVVGDWDTIAPGDPTGRARMADFFDDRSTEVPLRDPLTMKPMGSAQPAAEPAPAAP
ncbi:MAG: M16 family metallopeptidase [Planctomycetota bacterium]